MVHLLLVGLDGLQAWPGLLVIVGLAFIAMGVDLARHERAGFSRQTASGRGRGLR